jgi:hypothetical protein
MGFHPVAVVRTFNNNATKGPWQQGLSWKKSPIVSFQGTWRQEELIGCKPPVVK